MTVDAYVNISVPLGKTIKKMCPVSDGVDPSQRPISVATQACLHPTQFEKTSREEEESRPTPRAETSFAEKSAGTTCTAPRVDEYPLQSRTDTLISDPAAHASSIQCAFCRDLGSPRTCGTLVPVVLDGRAAAVHHACALWAPQGCDEYLNLASEWARSQPRRCAACCSFGAAVACTHPGCRVAYHLPCAAEASDVVLDKATFELWCPQHAIDGGSDDDDAPFTPGRAHLGRKAHNEFASNSLRRPRRYAALTRRHRFQRAPGFRNPAANSAAVAATAVAVSEKVQRPRTDWQRLGDVWVKVVPPWWCEHRTVHFANKVFRELFCGGALALLVDKDGRDWKCAVACETRNDLRLQYTLQGEFPDYWDSIGVSAGDVLTFERDVPTRGKIEVRRYPQGRGLEESLERNGGVTPSQACGTASNLIDTAVAVSAGSLPQIVGGRIEGRESVRPGTIPATSAHPNRWVELPDGSASKTVYKSTLVHQHCPIAGWLFLKLYGRYPEDNDRAEMLDSRLGSKFVFEVTFVAAANIHYITGRAFASWLSAAGVTAGDQIRMWKEGDHVMIGRSPAAETCMGPPSIMIEPSANDRFDAGACLPGPSILPAKRASKHDESPGPKLASSSPNFLSPRSTEGLEALYALAAAARYAGQHGTPAIQAVLDSQQGAPGTSDSIEERLKAAGMPPPPSPFVKKLRLGPNGVIDAPVADGPRHALPAVPSSVPPAVGMTNPKALSMPQWPQSQLKNALYQLLRQCQLQQTSSSMTGPLQGMAGAPQMPPAASTAFVRPPQPHSQPKDVQPSNGAAAFSAIMQAFRRHEWTPNETALLVQFRAKYALLDGVGREVAHMSVVQLQDDKDALLEIIKGIVVPSSSTHAPPAKSSSATPCPQAATGGGGTPLSQARPHGDGGCDAVKMDAHQAHGSWH